MIEFPTYGTLPDKNQSSIEHDFKFAPRPEEKVSLDLENELSRLGDRCEWRKEISLMCWTHSLKESPDRLRIDYVARLDHAPFLIGLEVKAAIATAADLGRALFQCAQYSHGYVAPHTAPKIVPEWVGKPLKAVFLYVDIPPMREWVTQHATAAHRLYGPANVGFAFRTPRRFELRLCSERFWCEIYGFNRGSISSKSIRSGNGSCKIP